MPYESGYIYVLILLAFLGLIKLFFLKLLNRIRTENMIFIDILTL